MKHAFLSSIAVATAAMSGVGAAQAEPFQGPWVGVDVAHESYPDELSGTAVALSVGWDWRLSERWVIGVEGRYGMSDANAVETITTPAGVSVSRVNLDRPFGAAVRFGRILGDDVLVYGAIGAERFEVTAVRTLTPRAPCTACAPLITDFSFDEDVVTAGMGVEWAVSDAWSARAFYMRADGDAYDRHSVGAGVRFTF